MGVIIALFIAGFVIKGLAGWSNYSAHNKWYEEYNKEVDKHFRETNARMAKEGDYAIGAFGMIETARYSDGSFRYVPGKWNQRAEKGKYF